ARLLLLLLPLMPACTRFEPRRLSPSATADRFASRSLTNAEIEGFLQKNLPRQLTNWPAAAWDFEMLTLAAFYYHPSLELARADWHITAGAIKTAKERPNPTVTVSGLHEPVPDAPAPWVPSLMFDLP